jgi:uncharacterized membrane protein YedE/YeeE
MMEFSAANALLGGVLIGSAAAIMLLFNGRIAGISGILGGIIPPHKTDTLWRVVFLVSLVIGAWLLPFLQGRALAVYSNNPWWITVLGGVLVGYGTRLGNGCTSGHGVCGVARFSMRSIVATMTFIATAMITVYFVRHGSGA